MKIIDHGVPQGSILGPTLLGIYVNYLHVHVDCFLIQYDDDTQLLHSGTIEDLKQIIKDTEGTHVKSRDYYLNNGLNGRKLNAFLFQIVSCYLTFHLTQR